MKWEAGGRRARAAELRYIVDVDGQFIGIEPAVVDATILKALAGVKGELMQVRRELEVPLGALQSIALREDEVLFFRSKRTGVISPDSRRAA